MRLWWFAVVSLMAVACQSGKQREDNVIRVAYLPISHALPVVEMARDTSLHIELVKYGTWPELMDALNTGRVDAASVLMELAVAAREKGAPLTAVALGHRKGNVVVVAPAIHTAADLKGHAFAIPHRNSTHYILLREMLERNKMTLNDVNIIELSPSEMPSALSSGRISGYCVAEPFGAIAVGQGSGHVLYQSDELWKDAVCCGLVFNHHYLQDHPSQARRFVEAYLSAGQRLADPQRALKDLQSINKQSPQVLKASLAWIDFSDLRISPATYRDLSSKMKKYGLAAHPLPYTSFVKKLVRE